MSRMLSRISRKRCSGRLEGTNAFPSDDPSQARCYDRLFDDVDITAEQEFQSLS
jgi:hypothetical protein